MADRHPGEFAATCERCKQYREDCLVVAYSVPPSVTPPPTEPLIGPDYISERQVVDPDDIRVPTVTMCRECRARKDSNHSR